uniref:SAP domain-containing protein n=1 Tax=Palpitomonas bilix TaxID=652834 RepID=A0A7S3DJ70_9EUKA|mmetsp:Transcript_40245/g.104331  ORF Transcript_40245/g.104331 Transcript_40245/m.104331 type:complete len:418 (+) Transcript_40245:1056-2309(+)
MAPPSVNEAAFETKVRKLRVPELKTLLKECMIPSDGRKEVLEERLLQFCTHLTDREKEGIFRLLHIEDTNINEYNPVTLPHHLGPVTLVSGGDKEEPDGHIPLGYESVRRFYIEAKDNSKNVSKTISKVFTLHYLRTHPAQSHARELQVSFVSQVSIDTPRGVRTFQSPDPNAAFYTAVKRILDESEDLSQPEKDLLLRKAYTISSRGLGRTLMGINMETRVGKRVKRATDRQHQRGCYRGTAADVACLNRFAHLSKYNSLPCIPVGHKGPPPPHQAALKPWEAPAHVAALVPSTEEALSPVLEVFFPMWELKENGILLSSQPIEGGRGQFSVDGKPKAGDKDKVSHEHWGGPISRTGRQGVRKTRRRRSRLGFSSFFSFSFSMMMMIQYFFCVSEENQRGLSGDRGLSSQAEGSLE